MDDEVKRLRVHELSLLIELKNPSLRLHGKYNVERRTPDHCHYLSILGYVGISLRQKLWHRSSDGGEPRCSRASAGQEARLSYCHRNRLRKLKSLKTVMSRKRQ